MMLDQLDKSKTYILGVVETHTDASRIQVYRENSFDFGQRWTHVAALWHRADFPEWQIEESRWPCGCHHMYYADWIEELKGSDPISVVAIPVALDIKGMMNHIGKEFAIRYVLKLGKGEVEPKPDCYIFCSELIRLHDGGILATDPTDTFPADYQEWAKREGIEPIVLYEKERVGVCR